MSVQEINLEDFYQNGGQFFSINVPFMSNQTTLTADSLSFKNNYNSSTGSISLPSNLFNTLPSYSNTTRVYQAVFVTESLFLRRNFNFLQLSSVVLSATVVGTNLRGIKPPINLTFQINPVSSL